MSEKKEIAVKLPQIPDFQTPEIIKNTIQEERKKVFLLSKKTGQSLSGLMIALGILISILSFNYLFPHLSFMIDLPHFWSLLTPEFLMISIGILGLLNVVCGFVLLTHK